MYDYIVVGSGLYGAIFAHEAKAHGKSVLVVDKRPNIAGNVYTENIEGINVHKYGAHIFHTNNKKVWQYITQFAEFNRFTNSPVANYKGELYSLPFNMYTFNKMWGVVTPEEAAAKIEEQRKEITGEPQNLEEQAISLVGRDIYEKLIKGYTEKQWGRDCKELPAFIIKRLPVRLTFDNNYFNALYQGIPVGGYTKWWPTCWTALRCGSAQTIWNTRQNWMHWLKRLCIPDLSTLILTTSWARWNIVLFALRTNCWTSRTFKETQRSIIPTAKHRGPALLSISGLSLAKMKMGTICQKRSLAASILLNGSPVMSPTIQ